MLLGATGLAASEDGEVDGPGSDWPPVSRKRTPSPWNQMIPVFTNRGLLRYSTPVFFLFTGGRLLPGFTLLLRLVL